MPRCSSAGTGPAPASASSASLWPSVSPSQPPASGSSARISYCGLANCKPPTPCSTLPNNASVCPARSTSFRKRWLNQTARAVPVRSRSATSKTLKPGRRVRLIVADTTVPIADAIRPGASSASGRGCPRSS